LLSLALLPLLSFAFLQTLNKWSKCSLPVIAFIFFFSFDEYEPENHYYYHVDHASYVATDSSVIL
jgi:hypothetical protein